MGYLRSRFIWAFSFLILSGTVMLGYQNCGDVAFQQRKPGANNNVLVVQAAVINDFDARFVDYLLDSVSPAVPVSTGSFVVVNGAAPVSMQTDMLNNGRRGWLPPFNLVPIFLAPSGSTLNIVPAAGSPGGTIIGTGTQARFPFSVSGTLQSTAASCAPVDVRFQMECKDPQCPGGRFGEVTPPVRVNICPMTCPAPRQILVNGVCTDCPPGQIAQGGVCVQCPPNQIQVGNTCQTCMPGQVVNPTQTACINCAPNQIVVNNACVSCPAGQYPNPARTACISCPAGQIVVNGVCTLCPADSITLDGITCQACLPGQIVVNNMCTACPPGQISINNVCTVCGPNQIVVNNACVNCPAGSITVDHLVCMACPPNQVTVNGVCTSCQPSQIVVNNVCTNCTAPLIPNPAHTQCVPCEAGTIYENGICKACLPTQISTNGICLTCPPGQHNVNNVCVACEDGAVVVDNQCVACVPPKKPNPERTSCVGCLQPICFPYTPKAGEICTYTYPAPNPNKCVDTCPTATCIQCPAGKVPNADNTACVSCPADQVSQNGVCVSCPNGQIPVNNVCTSCPAGQIENPPGTCTSCPNGQVPVNNQCVTCTADQILVNGVCTSCPVGQVPNPAKTVCVACGIDQIESAVGTCVDCSPGQVPLNNVCTDCSGNRIESSPGQCTTCPSGTTASADHLRCDQNPNLPSYCVNKPANPSVAQQEECCQLHKSDWHRHYWAFCSASNVCVGGSKAGDYCNSSAGTTPAGYTCFYDILCQ